LNESDYKGLIDRADWIKGSAMHIPKPDLSQVDLEQGFNSSRKACEQEDKVYMSPIAKNMMKAFGDVKGDDWVLKVSDPPTKAEEWLWKEVTTRLTKQFGPKTTYDINTPLDSIQHYGVDCWDNAKENMRQIQPGQAEERLNTFKQFGTIPDDSSVRNILLHDKLMQVAVDRLLNILPEVVADLKFDETSAPFETKHTNVG